MPLTNLCDDVFQSMLDYLEYEEIVCLSRAGAQVFIMCDDYVHRDVGVSVADLYHFTDDSHRGCVTAAEKKMEIKGEWNESNGFPISAFDTLRREPCLLTDFVPTCSTASWIS